MTTHTGGCHCGKVAYSFEGEIGEVTRLQLLALPASGAGCMHFIPSYRLSP